MPWTQDQMAARAAQELQDGFYVNLGIGIPTLVANHVPADKEVWLQSENGMLGIGPFPTEDQVDAVALDIKDRVDCGRGEKVDSLEGAAVRHRSLGPGDRPCVRVPVHRETLRLNFLLFNDNGQAVIRQAIRCKMLAR